MSNETPNSVTKKIKSARKLVLPVLCFVILVWSIAALYRQPSAPRLDSAVFSTLEIAETKLEITSVFDTPQERTQGLSDRTELQAGEAVLFVLDEPAKDCFWMKDMRFSIDIIWLNHNKEVIYLKQNVSLETYPETFCPNEPASYVIETNAFALDATIGQTVRLQ